MASWPPAPDAYGLPPRPRSRSPYRGYGGGEHTLPDHYRDWERDRERYYERERWEYDRHRSGYDHGPMGGRRSPYGDDGSRKRRRSPSLDRLDRYEPRPRYGDEYDHRGGRDYHGSSRRHPQDPHKMDYPASLKQYAEWFRHTYPEQAVEEDKLDREAEIAAGDGSKPRNGLKTKWEQYKKGYSANQLQIMFEYHRKSPWFQEKYSPDPEFVALRARVRKEGWRGKINAFVADLEAGKHDPSNETVPSMEGQVDVSPDLKPVADEDINMIDGEDDTNDAKTESNNRIADGKRVLKPDEVEGPPEGNCVMIRTIPPDIGRQKLETACGIVPGFIHMALGEPMQKKQFYRAGWVKFVDGTNMTETTNLLSEMKIDKFKLHVTHAVQPYVCRARIAPDVASRPERLEKDLSQIKALASILEDELETLRATKVPKFPEFLLNRRMEGEDEPTEEQPAEVVLMSEEDDDDPKDKGSQAVESHIDKLYRDLQPREDDTVDFETRKTIIALDLYIAYLRQAFNTCYYCALVADHSEELVRKCIKHVRRPLPSPQPIAAPEKEEGDVDNDKGTKTETAEAEPVSPGKSRDNRGKEAPPRNDDRWLDWLDGKIALLINRAGVDVKEHAGKDYDEELKKAVTPFMKQEDEGKFRCNTCAKLFKAVNFVEKHIANKHKEHVTQLEDIPFFNNFVLDPHHIMPFTHAPPPPLHGHAVLPPHAYGLLSYNVPEPAGSMLRHSRHDSINGNAPREGWDTYTPGYENGRRLSDRMGGYAPDERPGFDQLPAKPSFSHNGVDGGRGRGRRNREALPPPPNAKEDPRASAGRKVSYYDMDAVAAGDVELTY